MLNRFNRLRPNEELVSDTVEEIKREDGNLVSRRTLVTDTVLDLSAELQKALDEKKSLDDAAVAKQQEIDALTAKKVQFETSV